ncbi:MAG: response regulator [Deltaproteobacteria bacterium]|nr:response regulator [Deltaproteobacteria bacterium]
MEIIYSAIVDDDDEIIDLIELILKEEGLLVRRFNQAEDLLDLLPSTRFDLIISDLMLPGISGLDLLDEVHLLDLDIPFVIITGYASLESAIEAVNRGAFYYIKKPFNIEEIRFVINQLRQRQNLLNEMQRLRDQVEMLSERIEKTTGTHLDEIPAFIYGMPLNDAVDVNRAFAAIEYLGKLKIDGLITNDEFSEYKGKILKRII